MDLNLTSKIIKIRRKDQFPYKRDRTDQLCGAHRAILFVFMIRLLFYVFFKVVIAPVFVFGVDLLTFAVL